jgi:hypothetical protein
MTQEWKKLYEAAIIETDGSKLEERIEAAESALHGRLGEGTLDHGMLEENRAIADALNRLDILRSEARAWRESKPDHTK